MCLMLCVELEEGRQGSWSLFPAAAFRRPAAHEAAVPDILCLRFPGFLRCLRQAKLHPQVPTVQ